MYIIERNRSAEFGKHCLLPNPGTKVTTGKACVRPRFQFWHNFLQPRWIWSQIGQAEEWSNSLMHNFFYYIANWKINQPLRWFRVHLLPLIIYVVNSSYNKHWINWKFYSVLGIILWSNAMNNPYHHVMLWTGKLNLIKSLVKAVKCNNHSFRKQTQPPEKKKRNQNNPSPKEKTNG
jgi:hypothetical protein